MILQRGSQPLVGVMLVFLLLAGLSLGDGKLLRTANQPTAQPVDAAACDCSCCEGTYRKPAELESVSVIMKCAPAWVLGEEGGDGAMKCASECKNMHDVMLRTSTNGNVDYTRFCFFQCRLIDDKVGGACIKMDKKLQMKSATRDGNGKDSNLPPLMPKIVPMTAAELAAKKAAEAAALAAATACPPPDPCVIEEVERKRDSVQDVYHKARDIAAQARALAR